MSNKMKVALLSTIFLLTVTLALITAVASSSSSSSENNNDQDQIIMENNNQDDDDDDNEDMSANGKRKGPMLTMQIPGTPVRRLIDPHGTWLAFMRHSERTNRQHRAKNARKTKQLNALRGPTGPQGPRGPPGPPGAEITMDVILNEFRQMVREAAERKVQSVVDVECEGCKPSPLENITGPYLPPLFEVDEVSVVPKVTWGFHCRLEEDKKVTRRALVELTGFYIPFVEGGFQRGEGLNPQEGRFTVHRKGVYNFIANLHAKQRLTRRRVHLKNNQSSTVRALICINSLCQQNASLETIIQITEAPFYGTIAISGLLELQKGHYVSIYIDNSSSDTIHILDSSHFSGTLIGL